MRGARCTAAGAAGAAEWKRFDPALPLEPGLFWCEDLREARRDLMAPGRAPK